MAVTEITITLADEAQDGKRSILVNGFHSHDADESKLQETREQAQAGEWQIRRDIGQAIGSDLYNLLDGSGQVIGNARREAHSAGNDLSINLQTPVSLDNLPFELLHDKGFLVLNGDFHLLRRVNDRNRLKAAKPPNRPLKMLFMACSPLDLPVQSVLQFEQEEESILAATGKFPIDIHIEDSGAIDGLADQSFEQDGFDIIHISGHAGIDGELGPVFYMEDEFARLAKITPRMLWQKLEHQPPKLLFVSGCSTGKRDDALSEDAFAHKMADLGIPFVLAWTLPVSDRGASRFEKTFYESMAQGEPVQRAIFFARREFQGDYHPWPLLRLFSDGSPLQPLIQRGQKLRAQKHKPTAYKMLQDSHVQVLEQGFVGRRRAIQQGLRLLRNMEDKNGLLIHGPAGVGKSCLAGKLIERSRGFENVVFRGVLKPLTMLQTLQQLCDRKGWANGAEILKAQAEFPDKIKALFRDVFSEKPVLLYFDDFEQNLEQHDDHWQLKQGGHEVVLPFLQALDWAEGVSKLMLTSRYPFRFERDGRDWPAETLFSLALMSMTGADLAKKKDGLTHIRESDHVDLYLEFGKGNPRLLDWLDNIAAKEDKYDVDGLRKKLQGRGEDYIRDYLADILTSAQGKAFEAFLHKAAVFRQPAPETAFAGCGEANHLHTGVNLTLFEKEQLPAREARYWVAPIIRDHAWGKLAVDAQKAMHTEAYNWYDQALTNSEQQPSEWLEEAVHHSLACDHIRGACGHAMKLGTVYDDLLLYRDSADMQAQVAARIDDDVVQETVQEKDGNVAVLFNDLGFIQDTLGDSRKAIEFYNKALVIFKKVYGEEHPHTRTVAENIAGMKE